MKFKRNLLLPVVIFVAMFCFNTAGAQMAQGVPKDDCEAVQWFQKAADQGEARAFVGLGIMYAEGRCVPKDDCKAVQWYQKAADQGNALASGNLGIMYFNGSGVIRDRKKGCDLMRHAAEHGVESFIDKYNRLCAQ